MGKCILHFDRIQIIDQKSSGAHADNDWMIVHWFVGRNGRQSHVLPLANAAGAAALVAGDMIRPISLEVECLDDELVTATYQIVDLGAFEPLAQAKLAGALVQRSGEALTQAYVEAAEFVAENAASPSGNVFDNDIEDMRSAIIDSMTAAFQRLIVPAFDEMSRAPAAVSGSSCIDVLHDIALFRPSKAMSPLRTRVCTYAADAMSGRGLARTVVHLVLERRLRPDGIAE